MLAGSITDLCVIVLLAVSVLVIPVRVVMATRLPFLFKVRFVVVRVGNILESFEFLLLGFIVRLVSRFSCYSFSSSSQTDLCFSIIAVAKAFLNFVGEVLLSR